jgi:hypothetical protein
MSIFGWLVEYLQGEPEFPEPETPNGHGEPHPPAGGFSVQAQALVSASADWEEVSGALKKARDLAVEHGWGQPLIFGHEATLANIGGFHDSFNETISAAAHDGHVITGLIADGLVETANDYSSTDQTQGAAFRDFERN